MGKVLVLDDESDLVELMVEELESLGIDAKGSSDIEQALNIIKEDRPVMVVSDIRMPGIDGLELMELAKSELEYPPEFVFVTGFSKYSEDHLRDSGASGVFHKPLDLDTFGEWVKLKISKE